MMPRRKLRGAEVSDSFRKVLQRIPATGAREPPSDEDAVSLHRAEGSAGPVKPKERLPKALLSRERNETVTETWRKNIRPPKWLIELRKRRATPKEVFDESIKYLRRRQDERSFRLAQMILDEIARMEGGSELVLSNITQELVDQFIVKGE